MVPDDATNRTDYVRGVDNKRIPELLAAYLRVIASDAGAGHRRPAKALGTTYPINIPCIEVKTLTSGAHRVGSQSASLQRLTQFLAEHQGVQNAIYAPIYHRLLLRRDSESVLREIIPLLLEARSTGRREVVLIHTNPDPAFIASYYKTILENAYGIRLTNVLVMTDHFITRSQCIWNLVDVDIIVAPDSQTADLTRHELRRWERIMRKSRSTTHGRQIPAVIVSGYPQDPTFVARFEGERALKREHELAPESHDPIDIAIPLGGGSPGMRYLSDLMESVSRDIPVRVWTTYKYRENDTRTDDYTRAMKRIRAETTLVTDNVGLIDAYADRFRSDRTPSLVVVKPGELSNQMMYEPRDVGGAIFLFAPPVGDQEIQNLKFFQSAEGGCVVPSDWDNDALMTLMLRLMTRDTEAIDETTRALLHEMKEKARGWRGLMLPDDADRAALCIVGLKRYGLLHAMAQYVRPVSLDDTVSAGDRVAMSRTGSTDFYYTLEEAYKRHLRYRELTDKVRTMDHGVTRESASTSKGLNYTKLAYTGGVTSIDTPLQLSHYMN